MKKFKHYLIISTMTILIISIVLICYDLIVSYINADEFKKVYGNIDEHRKISFYNLIFNTIGLILGLDFYFRANKNFKWFYILFWFIFILKIFANLFEN